jgi:predicted AlkP superfamily phosphohydrolase/phosphomutase
MKALIIGIDGGTWQLFDDYLLENHMPNLNSLKTKGFRGKLRSTDPAITPPAWTTCITGCQPCKHGVIDFQYYSFSEKRAKVTSSANCRVPTMFEHLSKRGYKVACINVPWTYPCREVNGIVVAGFGMPGLDAEFTYPKDFKQKLLSRIPDYIVTTDADTSDRGSIEMLERNLKRFERCMEQRAEMASLVCEEIEPDIMMVEFQSIDAMGHIIWSYMDSATRNKFPEQWKKICKTLEKFDQAIGNVLKLVGDSDAVVCVVSDHGLCRLKGVIRPNVFLREWGYLKLDCGVRSIGAKFMRSLYKLSKNHAAAAKSRRPLNWKRTKAMLLIKGLAGHIYVNLENRNLKGTVKQGEEYEQLLDELRDKFLELKYPSTGEPLFVEAIRPGKLYDDGKMENEITEDLVLIPNNGYVTCDRIKKDVTVKFLPEDLVDGNHHYEGMYVFSGPNIRKGEGPGHIVDIFPTICASLGVELPAYIDGRPMEGVFRQPVAIKYQKSEEGKAEQSEKPEWLSKQEELQIMKRIRALGYAE